MSAACSTASRSEAATFTRSTSTRLSKNVAPPPRSVRRVGVVELQLRSPKLCLFHQMLGVTTTPERTLSPTRARAMKEPRSLKTLTNSSCRMPRAVASATLISNCGSTADRRNESTSTNVEFKKCGDGGDNSCNGNLAANSGADAGDSAGGMYVGNGSSPILASRSQSNSHLPLGVGKPPFAKGALWRRRPACSKSDITADASEPPAPQAFSLM